MQKVTYGGVALQRVDLKNLDPNATNVVIVGIIIGKQRPALLGPSTRPEAGSQSGSRAVWNFTLRDSIQHYINVSYWGTPEQVFQANAKFSTGDVVEIVNPQVMIRKLNDNAEHFRPKVTSPYMLTLTDKSMIRLHLDRSRFEELLHITTKPTAMFVALHEIHKRGQSIQFADVLGAIRGINPTRTINTKSGQAMEMREIEVFDHTCPSFKITLWEPELITRSENWKPRTTILFLTDIRINWSSFARSFVGSANSRTIVTENPIGDEAKDLFEYAQKAPIKTFEIVEHLLSSMMASSSSLDEVMSVRQIYDRINYNLTNKQSGNLSFTVALFAFVTQLDLDGLLRPFIVKCGRCKVMIKDVKCENPECTATYENEFIEPEVTFSINMSFSDHTGTLDKCKLSGQIAEEVLGCSAKDFAVFPDETKCALKWKYLLEQCKVHIAVILSVSQSPIVSVLHLELANMAEVSRKLPVY